MSSLQLSLTILGALIMAGVVAYNAWVTRRSEPKHGKKRASPSLAVDPSIEAILDDGQDSTQSDEAKTSARWDLPEHGLSASASSIDYKGKLDALIDVITSLQLDTPIKGDFVLAAMPPSRRVGTKPFAIEGLNVLHEAWEPIQPSQTYSQLQAGLQLANRSGPINDIEFSEYVVKTQHFCDVITAQPDFPDMMDEVARARDLDQFASARDAQLSFTIRAVKAAWSVGYVQLQASKLGFVAGSLPGKMILPSTKTGDSALLSLRIDSQAAMADDPEQSAVREIRLELDVGHVSAAQTPYTRMRDVGETLCREMDGVLTDDSGVRLGAATLDQIGQDVLALYGELMGRDLPAGSALAKRLFS
ncbi:cell division protein FtsZ [Comamonadaceae bacterium M7527]|nr:cell division protein FtsZ [Comamonadaceae bacterium M7527]